MSNYRLVPQANGQYALMEAMDVIAYYGTIEEGEKAVKNLLRKAVYFDNEGNIKDDLKVFPDVRNN